ncbi:hypothetical protein TNIN_115021 [Trichonephila inaurata madagascariensis]|uniref:Uncharacterized protein n=1 Tax=Trichonephila inaurata madagascariensis TaxID=2747483 RepID=A0A8X7CIU1_9ARAC|nr:hypothetical protein TNIN_115021 [Trichonephila inaurata madagascariensis]
MYHSILLIPCPDPLEAFRIWPPSPLTLTDITDDSRVIKRQSSAEDKAVQPLKRLRFKNAFLPFRLRISDLLLLNTTPPEYEEGIALGKGWGKIVLSTKIFFRSKEGVAYPPVYREGVNARKNRKKGFKCSIHQTIFLSAENAPEKCNERDWNEIVTHYDSDRTRRHFCRLSDILDPSLFEQKRNPVNHSVHPLPAPLSGWLEGGVLKWPFFPVQESSSQLVPVHWLF